MAKFQIFKDKAGEWHWRLKASGNHEIIAHSVEGFVSKTHCEYGIQLVKTQAPGAVVEEQ